MKIVRLISLILCLLLFLCSCELPFLREYSSFEPVENPLRENAFLKSLDASITEQEIQDVRDCIVQCKESCFGEKKNAERLEKNLYYMKWELDWIDYKRDVADLLFHYDTSDETAQKNRQYAYEVYYTLHNEYWSAIHEMQNRGGSLLSVVESFLQQEHPNRRTAYFDGDAALAQMEDLYSEFCAYNFEGTAEEVHGIYVEYLKAAQKYAESYGYENYYACETDWTYYRDYGKEEREQFREYVKQYIVPLYLEYDSRSDKLYDRLGIFARYDSDLYTYKAYDQFEENYIFLYLDSLPESIGDRMRDAFEQGNIIIGDTENSLKTALVADVSDMPVCYFHKDMLDLVTVSHELGHYCQNLIESGIRGISYDMKEVCSQANTLLMLRYLRDEIDTRAYEAFEVYEISNLLYQTVLETVKDEFDEIVFSDPNAYTYTAEELTAIMEELIVEYGIDEIGGSMENYAKTYWHRQGIYQPVYRLSYGTSALVAFQLYRIADEDYDEATERYRLFVETVDTESSFLGALENAGLYSPFDEQLYLEFIS